MRLVRRVLATTVAALALAAGGVVVAGPAAASPQDGQGCVGLPSVPDTYVCVISLTPTNALPTTTTTPINVTVPAVCYYLACTAPQVVAVPVPGVTPGSGVIATLWYKGQYIPISVGTATVLKTVTDTVNLVNAKVDQAYSDVIDLYYDLMYYVNDPYNLPYYGTVIRALENYYCAIQRVLDPYYYCWY